MKWLTACHEYGFRTASMQKKSLTESGVETGFRQRTDPDPFRTNAVCAMMRLMVSTAQLLTKGTNSTLFWKVRDCLQKCGPEQNSPAAQMKRFMREESGHGFDALFHASGSCTADSLHVCGSSHFFQNWTDQRCESFPLNGSRILSGCSSAHALL